MIVHTHTLDGVSPTGERATVARHADAGRLTTLATTYAARGWQSLTVSACLGCGGAR